MASNPQSKFSSFSLYLGNDVTITGLKYIPESPSSPALSPSPYQPLLILIHGGTCTAHNFDVAPGALTATTYASQFSVPIVSINRPGYLESTPLTISKNSTYHKTLGHFNHEVLFPALWRTFGQPNNCTSLVPLAHSLGSPGIIISSALHAQDPAPGYPLAGIIFSGWGTQYTADSPPPPMSLVPSEKLAWKRLIMLGHEKLHCAPPEAEAAITSQDHSMEDSEGGEFFTGVWNSYWREYSDRVTVPIMWAMGEHDRFWSGTREHVHEYETYFKNCARFDGSVVLGAPHAIEWSHYAEGWYTRCFGFAKEVSEWLGRKDEKRD